MKLTKLERETIILFNEAEPNAEIYTHNTRLKNRLAAFMEKHPTLVNRKEADAEALSAIIPKNMLTIAFRSPLSSTERNARTERARKSSPLMKSPVVTQKNETITGTR